MARPHPGRKREGDGDTATKRMREGIVAIEEKRADGLVGLLEDLQCQSKENLLSTFGCL